MPLNVVFWGTPEFALPALAMTHRLHNVLRVITQPDRSAGRGGHLRPPPVKSFALEHDLPVLQPIKVRDGMLTKELALLSPDLFIVVAYGRILPPDLLAVPRLGCWNVHASLLPKYRGAAPIQWAIIRGEQETGITLMKMDEGMDTGPVVAQAKTDIRPDENASQLSIRLAHLGGDVLAECFPGIIEGSLIPTPQDHSQATLAPILQKSDGLLDFSLSATMVSNHVRGVEVWPGAMAMGKKGPLRVFSPTVLPGSGKPGEVLGQVNEGLLVACGDDAIAFGELQLAGRNRMDANAFLAGNPIPRGANLSNPPSILP
jgi:methionyl-tRNA formyltransferase